MICKGLNREQANTLYREVLNSGDDQALRRLCREDLFFLLTIGCKRKDINKDWLYDRCREVEAEPDGCLDLWFREGYKSTIITFGLSIRDILADPNNTTIGIFSHTRPIAKAFLSQIKTEFERNTFLQRLFDDVLWENPKSEASVWSLDHGIIVKRDENPKEPTVSAWGLVDGQPTSKHFTLLVYDDVVTKESVSTPEQIKKVTESWQLSLNLGARGGRMRCIGTRYHANDTYATMIKQESVKPRIKPATHDGKVNGQSVFLPPELLAKKRRDFGPYVFAAQMLQNPTADKAMGFKKEWLKFYKTKPEIKGWNLYLLVDPASEKKKTSDYTVMMIIGLAPDNNYYLIDAIRDRLNLTERTQKIFQFVREYEPRDVGYEKYGMQSDIEHIEHMMEIENFRFNISPLGGGMAKDDRIRRLVPVFEQSRMWLPEKLTFIDYEQRVQDFTTSFIDDEFEPFPVAVHDDMLDCMARITDPELGARFPKLKKEPVRKPPRYTYEGSQGSGWMA